MGVLLDLRDRLTNIMSGKGTTADRRVYERYAFIPLDPQQAEAGYRSSWLVRKIIDIPPFDMTREWRDWQADAPAIEKLEAEERRLQIKTKCQRALILSRLYGGGALILGTKDTDPTQPLDTNKVSSGGLTYVHVMSRYQLSEGQQRLDPADPWFGQPEYFGISQTGNGAEVQLHPSRVIPFVGQRAPEGSFLSATSWFWGDPIMQSIGSAVRNADLAQDGFAALIDEAKIDIVKIPDLTAKAGTEEYENRLMTRLSAASLGKSTWRMLALDGDEEWQQRQITWAGMPEMMVSFLNAVAGAADIPITRLLGMSPKGLQSNGDGEQKDYQSMVRARQNELLQPALDRIDELLIPSALGSKPSDVYYEFAPLSQMDEKDAATIEKQRAETVQAYATSGLIPDVALSAMAKNSIIESGRWPGSEKAFEEAEAAIAADPSLDPNAADDPNAGVPAIETTPPPAGSTNVKAHIRKLKSAVAALKKAGSITADQAVELLTDAAPRSLYVSRKLLNGTELIKWAKGQGFTTTVPVDELHVTVLFSRKAVDWMTMGQPWDQDDQGRLRVAPGGARVIDKFGDTKQAVVLLFNSSSLSWRHEEMVRNGASHDFDDYHPHLTITYDAPADLDLLTIEPYRGGLVFGPEVFSEVVDDWEQSLSEE